MDSKCFYGKKVTYPNSNNDTEISDESAFSESNNDSDYLPINPIQTGRFGNFVRLGGGLNVPALFVCLYLSNF